MWHIKALIRTGIVALAAITSIGLYAQDDGGTIDHFESLIKAGKYAEARSEIEPFVGAHPSSWQAWYQLGYAEFRLHDVSSSLTHLCKSLELNSNFAESHKILAYDLNILGRQDLALRELERTIAL